MASSTASFDASPNTYPNFTFSSHPFMTTASFSDLLAGDDDSSSIAGVAQDTRVGSRLSDRVAERAGAGWGVPKFKSLPPPSLPISPPSVSPSSYFAIPAGLSPAELLDSPVLLSSSNILPSPTTGAFAAQWKNNLSVKQENKSYTDFSFHSQPNTAPTASSLSSLSMFQPSHQPPWSSSSNNFQEPNKAEPKGVEYNHQAQPLSRRSDDGYNWRKYGQKQVKGSENPRSYYKCTYPNCPTKKKVERSLDGQITEIVYKGTHNHPKPQSTRRSSSSSSSSTIINNNINNSNNNSYLPVQAPSNDTTPDQSYNGPMDSAATPDNSSISIGDDEFEQSSQKTKSGGGGDDFDDDEPDAKRWKREGENEGISAPGNRTVREPRVVVQTTSDIDILDDGYRWRKYGQKVVKGNPNPRSYYKCTNPGCPVRKHVERASHDLRAVITTYEGKHNHDVPAARGSGLSNRLPPQNNNINNTNMMVTAATRPSLHNNTSNINNNNNNMRLPQSGPNPPFTLEMLQGGPSGRGFQGFGNNNNNSNSNSNSGSNSKAKDEPRDDNSFLESLLC